jgi:hypothetical protein
MTGGITSTVLGHRTQIDTPAPVYTPPEVWRLKVESQAFWMVIKSGQSMKGRIVPRLISIAIVIN